jgi:hypothetical protein
MAWRERNAVDGLSGLDGTSCNHLVWREYTYDVQTAHEHVD